MNTARLACYSFTVALGVVLTPLMVPLRMVGEAVWTAWQLAGEFVREPEG